MGSTRGVEPASRGPGAAGPFIELRTRKGRGITVAADDQHAPIQQQGGVVLITGGD